MIPRHADTIACLVNLARYLVQTEGLAHEAALYLAENILGIGTSDADPHGIRHAARAALSEALQ